MLRDSDLFSMNFLSFSSFVEGLRSPMYNTDFLSAGFVCTTSCHDSSSDFLGSYSSCGAVGLSFDDRSYGAVRLSFDDREGMALFIYTSYTQVVGRVHVCALDIRIFTLNVNSHFHILIFMFLRFLLSFFFSQTYTSLSRLRNW